MDADAVFIATQCGLNNVINSTLRLSSQSFHEFHPPPAAIRTGPKRGSSIKVSGIVVGKDIDKQTIEGVYSPDRDELQRVSHINGHANKNVDDKSYVDYIKQLSTVDQKRLYKVYKYDFDIFGYNHTVE